jgi:dTDP-glucose 4,6-dehydratase
MILVASGSGFIGANFILDWINYSRELLVNIDLLTMGNSVLFKLGGLIWPDAF